MAVPIRSTFLDSLEVLTHCGICLSSFDTADHVAVRTRCQHVFGRNCLSTWTDSELENSNCCPECRTTRFIRPLRVPKFLPEEVPLNKQRRIKFSVARDIMHRLWNICEYSKQSVEIYDFELERCVQRSIGANYHHEIPIFSRELFPMVQIAKDMIIYMCTNPTTQGLSTVECNEKWVPRFVDAIGWQLIDEENASAVPDFVENGDDSMKEDGPDKE